MLTGGQTAFLQTPPFPLLWQPMDGVVKIILLAAGFELILAVQMFAGPPFLTDDPGRWIISTGVLCPRQW
jgi:hypothetical protein